MSEVEILKTCDLLERVLVVTGNQMPPSPYSLSKKLVEQVREYFGAYSESQENTPEPAEDDVCSGCIDRSAELWNAYLHGITDATDFSRIFIEPHAHT